MSAWAFAFFTATVLPASRVQHFTYLMINTDLCGSSLKCPLRASTNPAAERFDTGAPVFMINVAHVPAVRANVYYREAIQHYVYGLHDTGGAVGAGQPKSEPDHVQRSPHGCKARK
jgi:hypothetical protein